MDEVTQLSTQVTELAYALDTFYFLIMGAFVMWMAAGFTMLEAGLVRAKNTAEIHQERRSLLDCLHHVHVVRLFDHVSRCI